MNRQLSPENERFIQDIRHHWIKAFPMESALWGVSHEVYDTDLSDDALEKWELFLNDTESRLETLPKTTELDRVVTDSISRFVNEQKWKHIEQRIYRTQASGYLRLIVFSLLSYIVVEDEVDGKVERRLKEQLGCARKWAEQAGKRVSAGEMMVSGADRRMAELLVKWLNEWKYYALPEVAVLKEEIIRSFFQSATEHSQRQGTSIRLGWYLKEILQVDLSYKTIIDRTYSQLQQDMRDFRRSLYDTVDDSAETDEMLWIKDTEWTMRKQFAKTLVRPISPPTRIVPAPAVLQHFVQDALFLPASFLGGSANDPAWLFIHPAYINQSTSKRWKSNLSLVLAHEGFPGHVEQYFRSMSSPLHALLQITRSPIGLEGWAFHMEALITELETEVPYASTSVLFFRIRRFMQVFQTVYSMMNGREKAKECIESLLAPLSDEEKGIFLSLRHSQTLSPFVYVLGYMETAEALQKMPALLEGKSKFESYLHWGPLLPKHVARLCSEFQV